MKIHSVLFYKKFTHYICTKLRQDYECNSFVGPEARRVKRLKIDQIRKWFGCILLVSFIFIGFFSPLGTIFKLPKELVLLEGDHAQIPARGAVQAAQVGDGISMTRDEDRFGIDAIEQGNNEIILEIAGIPVKKIDVSVLKDVKVIPGGQSIGVKINSKGVLVVGHHQVQTNDGKISPGEKADIKVGDLITKINGKTIESMSEVGAIVQEAGEKGEKMLISLERNNDQFETYVEPVLDVKERRYKLGLYIRDSAAGIGTLTFYEPTTKKYGALGHVISDMDTKKPIVVKDGYIVPSTVTSIQKGQNGIPGEKMARFRTERELVGNIEKNNQFGIYGTLNKDLKNGIIDKPLPIALSHQVKKGKAQILTVVNEDKVELFDIEIVNSIPQKFPATKGMVIKITDPKLLDVTGGIVQGMSGSPIIQDGKLVGAVTHVFVNDPTSGYGVHIEWMLNEANLDLYGETWGMAS